MKPTRLSVVLMLIAVVAAAAPQAAFAKKRCKRGASQSQCYSSYTSTCQSCMSRPPMNGGGSGIGYAAAPSESIASNIPGAGALGGFTPSETQVRTSVDSIVSNIPGAGALGGFTPSMQPQPNFVNFIPNSTPSFTPGPSFTPSPSFTPGPSFTPTPTFTPAPSYDPAPSYPAPSYDPGNSHQPAPSYDSGCVNYGATPSYAPYDPCAAPVESYNPCAPY